MAYIKWTKTLAVNVKELDTQHRNIIRAANEMLEAMSQGKGHKKYYSLIKHLETYIDEHFTLEETYMTRYGYKDFDDHKKEHEAFKVEFSKFRKQFEEEGSTTRLVIKTMSWMHEWLLDHVLSTDQKMVDFLKPEMKKDPRVKR